jgi:anti-anti-sigma factor
MSYETETLELPDLVVEIKRSADQSAPDVIVLNGRITQENDSALNRMFPHFLKNTGTVHLDLTQLTYVNSSGIAILFSIFYRVRENNGSVAIIGMHPFVRRIFYLMDWPADVTVYDSPQEATK